MQINVTIKANLHIISCRLMPQKKKDEHCTNSECVFLKERLMYLNVCWLQNTIIYQSKGIMVEPSPPLAALNSH